MRHLWYTSGDLFLPKIVRQILEIYVLGSDRSLFYISLWSFMHALSGFLFSFMSNSLQGYIVIHTIWEIWQIYIKMTPVDTLRGIIDIFTDTCMGIAGFIVSRKWMYDSIIY